MLYLTCPIECLNNTKGRCYDVHIPSLTQITLQYDETIVFHLVNSSTVNWHFKDRELASKVYHKLQERFKAVNVMDLVNEKEGMVVITMESPKPLSTFKPEQYTK